MRMWPCLIFFLTDPTNSRKRILSECTTGELITCIGLTEPNAGSDLAAIRTKAVRKGDQYVINGQKTFITNGIVADVCVLAVRVDPSGSGSGGISMIAVEAGTPGFNRGRKLEKMGYHMQDTAELFFEDCRVPAGNLLGEEGKGFKYMMEKLARERLEVCVKCQTMAEECLKEALSYAKVREAFGRTIGSFQHNAFKLAEMATEVELGRTFLNTLVAETIRGDDITTKVSHGQGLAGGDGQPHRLPGRSDPRRLRLHGGIPHQPPFPGRPQPVYFRRHHRDHEADHRPPVGIEPGVRDLAVQPFLPQTKADIFLAGRPRFRTVTGADLPG